MNLPYDFIAIPPPEFLKERLAHWQAALKEYLPYKQWPHPDNLHITLTFLGPVSAEQ